jgi:KDO2-lipid IV(A) lauroyltransferase
MYYLLLCILYPLSLLPVGILYLLSDLLYLVGYKIAGYRKSVTYDNLVHAFPEKSPEEIKAIMNRFYHHFFDQIVELLKLLSISPKELNKRTSGNWDVLNNLEREGRNAYIMLGHTFNWEWLNVACQLNTKAQFAGVYMPVKSKAMNRLMSKMRTRGGGWLISMKAKKGFQALSGIRYAVGLIADQNPSNMNGVVWLPFMHREAPFFTGPELLAKRAGAAMVFAGIRRKKRGQYEINLQLVAKDASTMQRNEIIHKYVAFMEQQLREQPDNWLWTHKRWKYKREVTFKVGQ